MNASRITILILLILIVIGALNLPNAGTAESGPNNAKAKRAQPRLGEAMLSAIREPGPGELKTPQATARHLLEALRDHDVDEYLKCFPVRRELEKFDLAAIVEYIGVYSAKEVRRLPGDTYFNLQAIIRDKLVRLYQVTLIMLHPGAEKTEHIDLKTPDGKKRIAKIRESLDFKRLKKMKIGAISLRDVRRSRMPRKMRILGASDLKFVNATISLDDQKIKLTVVVAKFGKHWRVSLVMLD